MGGHGKGVEFKLQILGTPPPPSPTPFSWFMSSEIANLVSCCNNKNEIKKEHRTKEKQLIKCTYGDANF